jgi:4-hydroxy-4-methyl-2-oxoglutarate aldolase
MRSNVIISEIIRPPEDVIKKFKDVPVANIADALGKPSNYTLHPDIKPAFDNIRLLGTAVTVKEKPGCNMMTHAAIDLAQEGDVLVIDSQGYLGVATGGFLMSRKMIYKGIMGVVIDGAWRDRVEVKQAGFPVFARGWQPTGPHKELPGSVNVTISCGGLTVNPGDIVIGDDDGVIVVPRDRGEEVSEEAMKVMRNEEIAMAETSKEVITAPSPYSTKENLMKKGVKFK